MMSGVCAVTNRGSDFSIQACVFGSKSQRNAVCTRLDSLSLSVFALQSRQEFDFLCYQIHLRCLQYRSFPNLVLHRLSVRVLFCGM